MSYKTTKEIVNKYFEYIPFKQPILSSNGVMGGDSFACNQSSYLAIDRLAWKAFNADNTTDGDSWHSANGHPAWIEWYNPKPLLISSIQVRNRDSDGSFINSYTVSYSDDGTTYTSCKTGKSPNQTAYALWSISIDEANPHKYWRLTCNTSSGKNNAYTAIQSIFINAQELFQDYKDIEVYKAVKETVRKYYKYVYKSWVKPVLTSAGVMGGDSFAVAQSSSFASRDFWLVFGNPKGYWHSAAGHPQWVSWYNPEPLKVTRLFIGGHSAGNLKHFKVQASNDNLNWIDLKEVENTIQTADYEVDLTNNTEYYLYYRLYITSSYYGSYDLIDGFNMTAVSCSVVEGTPSDYDFYEDVDIYKVVQEVNTEQIMSIPQMNSNSQDGFTVVANHYDRQWGSYEYTLFSPVSSGWYAGIGTSKPDTISITFPETHHISKIVLKQNNKANSIAHNGRIEYTTDGITYTTLANFTMDTTLESLTTVDLDVNCLGYRLVFLDNASSQYPNNGVALLAVTTYEIV